MEPTPKPVAQRIAECDQKFVNASSAAQDQLNLLILATTQYQLHQAGDGSKAGLDEVLAEQMGNFFASLCAMPNGEDRLSNMLVEFRKEVNYMEENTNLWELK